MPIFAPDLPEIHFCLLIHYLSPQYCLLAALLFYLLPGDVTYVAVAGLFLTMKVSGGGGRGRRGRGGEKLKYVFIPRLGHFLESLSTYSVHWKIRLVEFFRMNKVNSTEYTRYTDCWITGKL